MKKFFLVTVLVFLSNHSWSQGCSDAGICSLNHGFQTERKQFKNTVEFAAVYGLGEADVAYFSPHISYTRRFTDHYSFTGKITLSTAQGSFGTRTQFGDAYLIGNYAFKENKNKQWNVLLGLKIPFTASNLKINGYSLPLDYQSSLGTVDVLVGTDFHYKKWGFNGALQLPVINWNKNSYFSEYSGTDDFHSTNLFERKPDALLRATYSIKTAKEKFLFKPSILFIYHLGEDTYENIFSHRESIKGSDGLTVNGNVTATYYFNRRNSIELSAAAPFVVRAPRPGGVTRSFLLGLLYHYSF